MGDARWDCRYRIVEECVPNVIAGDRGSCSPNPYGPAAVAVPVKRTYKHHVRHDWEQPAIAYGKTAFLSYLQYAPVVSFRMFRPALGQNTTA
jgi:hypothetical protein